MPLKKKKENSNAMEVENGASSESSGGEEDTHPDAYSGNEVRLNLFSLKTGNYHF